MDTEFKVGDHVMYRLSSSNGIVFRIAYMEPTDDGKYRFMLESGARPSPQVMSYDEFCSLFKRATELDLSYWQSPFDVGDMVVCRNGLLDDYGVLRVDYCQRFADTPYYAYFIFTDKDDNKICDGFNIGDFRKIGMKV